MYQLGCTSGHCPWILNVRTDQSYKITRRRFQVQIKHRVSILEQNAQDSRPVTQECEKTHLTQLTVFVLLFVMARTSE